MSEYTNPVDQAKHDYFVEGDHSNPYQGMFRREQLDTFEKLSNLARDNILGDSDKTELWKSILGDLVISRMKHECWWRAYEQAFDQCEIDELKR